MSSPNDELKVTQIQYIATTDLSPSMPPDGVHHPTSPPPPGHHPVNPCDVITFVASSSLNTTVASLLHSPNACNPTGVSFTKMHVPVALERASTPLVPQPREERPRRRRNKCESSSSPAEVIRIPHPTHLIPGAAPRGRRIPSPRLIHPPRRRRHHLVIIPWHGVGRSASPTLGPLVSRLRS